MKILLIILAVVAVFVLFAYLFIKLYKPFGVSPTKKDWKDIEYVTPILGETFNIKDYKNYQNEWWKNIN